MRSEQHQCIRRQFAVGALSFQRFEDDTTTLGLLDGSNSYRDASITWYDTANRGTNSATFGRDDGTGAGSTYYVFDATGALVDSNSDGIPDEAENSPRLPAGSDDWIASKTEYDSAGRGYRTFDNLGRITQTDFDLLNRQIRTITNYTDGVVSETEASDTDQTVG